MKKLALAAIFGAMALAASSGNAEADTAGNQQFNVVKVGSNPGTVIATGAITGAGTESNDRLQVPPGAPFQVIFHFPQGDLFQTVTPVGPPQVKADPRSCVSLIVLHVTTVVTGGTRTLAGVTGSSTATTHRTAIAGRSNDDRCLGPSATPVFEVSVVRATGTVNLG